jgi:hypothetical protein
MCRCLLLAVFVVAASILPALGNEASPKERQDRSPASDQTLPPPEQKTLESFGAANPSCREWSDGCAVCSRPDHGGIACSLPGIACQPATVTCRPEIREGEDKIPATTPAPAPTKSEPTKPAANAPGKP